MNNENSFIRDENSFNTHSLLYQENAKIAAIFWEWRHNLMTGCFTAIIALFALSGWFYQQNFGRWTALPLLIGFIVSFVSLNLDERNRVILNECYKIGAKIENKLYSEKEDNIVGIFGVIRQPHDETLRVRLTFTYTGTLRVTYTVLSLILLILALLIISGWLDSQNQQINNDSLIKQFSDCLRKS